MSSFPVDLPPTMLRSTLYTNKLIGNIYVSGNVTSNLIFAENIYGNVTSNNFNAGGNITATYFIGNGSLLTGLTASTLPGNANIDIIGNVTASGNITAGGQVNVTGNVVGNYFIGNGSQLTGLLSSLPASANIDILGNVTAPGNVVVAGQVNVTGNVVGNYFLGNGALLTGIKQYVLPTIANIDIIGNVTAPGNVVIAGQVNVTGNVVGNYFIGNGALLSGLPATANIDIIGNVTAPGNVVVAGQVNVTGNVVGQYFLGNGALLSDIAPAFTASGTTITTGNLILSTDKYLSVNSSNSTSLAITTVGVNTAGNLVVLSNTGFIEQVNLNGYLIIPQGYAANTAVRLALSGGNAPIGSLVKQVDTGNTYLLTASPSNININWLEFTGVNYPVNTVFGRIGDVLATYGDYYDSYIALSANVGTVMAGNSVAAALQTLDTFKANIIDGNVSATYFIGNGSQLSGVLTSLPESANIDIIGNVSAPGNVVVAGQVDVTGNVAGQYFLGNGALLTGIEQYVLPGSANIDIIGNVTAAGNIVAAGQVNVTGNVVGQYFVGNGALLTGITSFVLPASANIDIIGNVTAPGNVAVAGQVNVIGNVVGQYFIGNGSQLTGITSFVLPTTANIDIVGNVTAAGNIVAAGQVNVTGNVVGQYFVGNGALLTGIAQYVLPRSANIDIIGNVTAAGNIVAAGQVNVTGNVVGNYFVGNGSQLTGVSSALRGIANIDVNGNVIGALANVANIIAAQGNVGNVRMLGGNVALSGQVNARGNVAGNYFIGNGSQLTGIAAALKGVAYIDVIGNVQSSAYINTDQLSASYMQSYGGLSVGGNQYIRGDLTNDGNITTNSYFYGNGYYLTLNGFTMIPQGNVANASVRLSLDVPVGSLITQEDNGLQYLLTAAPANTNSNWLNFTGTNFPVPSVFGRTGAIIASPNDYTDAQIQLTANVGVALTNVSDALSYLNENKANIVNGNVSATYFIGNGYQLTGLPSSALPAVANIDIYGNVTASGNVLVSGFISAVGDISGRYINGNGSLLTGVSAALRGTANIDIIGNVTASGNVVGNYFIGNGSQLTGLLSGLPTTGNIDIRGNVVAPGNITAGGQVNVTGNVVGNYFIGNGSQLTGLLSGLPATGNIDIRGNVTASGNIVAGGQVNVTGNIVGNYFVGNGSRLTGLLTGLPATGNIDIVGNVIGSFANVTTLIGITGNVGNVRMVGGNVTVSGQINTLGNVVAPFFIGNGSQLTGIVQYVLPGTANIDITGNVTGNHIGSFANVDQIIAIQGNVANVRMLGGNISLSGQVNARGNVAGNYFIGNGALLTGLTTSPNARYLSVGRATNQTIGTGTWSNVYVILNTTYANDGITYAAGSGTMTLERGVTYRVTAQVNFDAGGAYDFYYNLVYAGNGNPIGGSAASAMNRTTSSGNDCAAAILDVIVTPSVTTDYRLRMSGNVSAGTGEFIRPDAGTFLTVVGLGSGFQDGIPGTGNIDIKGNVIGTFANVTQVIAINGNVGNTRFLGGNVAVSGQVNVLGNVIAPYFIGNGSQLTGIGLPATGNIDIRGNVIGPYANVANLIAGNVTLPTIGNSTTNFGNYTPLVIDVSTGVVGKKSVEVPRFAAATSYCGTKSEGIMFMYKDEVWASGLGWSGSNFNIHGYPTSNPLPQPVCFSAATTPISGFVTVYDGGVNGAALTTDGRVFTWGTLNGSATANFLPIQVQLPQSVTQLSGPLSRTSFNGVSTLTTSYAAVLGNGQMYMWGNNEYGTLGRGFSSSTGNNVPAIPTGLANANIIKVVITAAWPGTVAALVSNGRLFTWGYNGVGECGLGNVGQMITTPTIVPGVSNVTDVQFMCSYSGQSGAVRPSTSTRVLCSNGTSFACGYNGSGELAIGNTSNISTFVRENSNRSNIAAIGCLNDGRDSAHLIIQNDGQVLFSGLKPLAGVPASANANTITTFFYNGDGFSSLGFQRNMLSNVGTPITTPKIHSAYSINSGSYYQGGILDNTGNLYAIGVNLLGNWGNTTTTQMLTFQYMNQYFPENKRASDFVVAGFDSNYGGATVALLDGSMISCGTNTYGACPYEIAPTTTTMPLWKYVPGYTPADVL